MSKDRTRLDKIIAAALRAKRELRKLESGGRKLTFPAFQAMALEIADTTEAKINKLETRLANANGADNVRAYVRRLAKAISEPTIPRPFPDAAKAARVYGFEELAGEMGVFRTNAAELQVLAARAAWARYGDRVFGSVDDLARFEERESDLRSALVDLCNQMRDAVSGADLIMASTDLPPDQRRAGLVKMTFRRAPDVLMSSDDWPLRLLDAIQAKRDAARKAKKEATRKVPHLDNQEVASVAA